MSGFFLTMILGLLAPGVGQVGRLDSLLEPFTVNPGGSSSRLFEPGYGL